LPREFWTLQLTDIRKSKIDPDMMLELCNLGNALRVPLVEIARRKGFISKEISFELKEKLEEISRMISALARDTEKDSRLENRK
jgi:hypothetical protein